MAKRVIELPEGDLGDAILELLTTTQRAVARTGGGKAVDYASVELAMEQLPARWRWLSIERSSKP